MLHLSLDDLRVLRAVAQRGSITAAAAELGYTQSSISKRLAALEATAGHRLAIRERTGVRLTRAGEVLLRHATQALGAMEQAEQELHGASSERMRPVRLGAFASAAAGILPTVLARLSRDRPDITITVREGTSATLWRGLRAGSLDLAVLADVATDPQPDDSQTALETEVLAEGPLRVAVSAGHRLAQRPYVSIEDLTGERWVIARSEGRERLLGVWPAFPGRPDAPYVVRDWLTKLQLVAGGAAITTVPDVLIPALPSAVRALTVTGGPVEHRRLLLGYIPHESTPKIQAVAEALRNAAT
ncbi:MAG: LysR family transcriptional regulator [Solirubrobacterales bacterium]|nr:LysR family transcriptional regulator [Solirubrobacterales bacterium]